MKLSASQYCAVTYMKLYMFSGTHDRPKHCPSSANFLRSIKCDSVTFGQLKSF